MAGWGLVNLSAVSAELPPAITEEHPRVSGRLLPEHRSVARKRRYRRRRDQLVHAVRQIVPLSTSGAAALDDAIFNGDTLSLLPALQPKTAAR